MQTPAHPSWRRLVRWALAGSMIGAALFVISGAWRDPWLWAYVAVLAGVALYGLLGVDEDLARERFHPPSPGADRIRLRVIRILAVAHLVVGAVDLGRWELGTVPAVVRAAALGAMAAASLLIFYTMRANRFFSSVVRIQTERGHRVVDRGPYAIVRHPGYAGMVPVMAFSGLALGSWLAFAIGLAYAALIIRRVQFEDQFLKANLAEYTEYAGRVKFRLVPALW